MSITDPRHVLADAMGLPPPEPALGFDAFGFDVAWRALREPTLGNVALAVTDERLWRVAAGAITLVLLLWSVLVIARARARFLGSHAVPVPLDYKAQRKFAAAKVD